MKNTIVATIFSSLLVGASPVKNNTTLPIVDLIYVRQQASSFNTAGQYYNFSNIAFAEPPLGDLRFAAPIPPKKINTIQDGNGLPRVCPQAYPIWLAELTNSGPVPFDPSNTEDCLYLDVFVPRTVFEQRKTRKASVLMFIYGGGLVIGSKTADTPSGLIQRAMQNTSSDGMIYVAANYRVGNFGTLGGDLFTSQGGSPNIALLDQRMAIDWVQEHIHLFGGDASRVTLIGESGGASSIAHQITGNHALSKDGGLPFSQVIMQSPAEAKPNSNELDDKQFHAFLKQLNVSSLAEVRKLSTAVLQQANYDLIQNFPTGVFPYTYNVDGRIVQSSARRAMLEDDCIAEDLNAMISYNLNEGFLFTPQDNTTFNTYVKEWLPEVSTAQLETINQLYPIPAYDSTFKRIETFIADLLINCNAAAYEKGFHGEAFAYQFSMPTPFPGFPFPPGYHIQDLSYTFYHGNDPSVYENTALDLQTRIVNFVVHGNPNTARETTDMPVYSSKHQMLNYTVDGMMVVEDNNAVGVNQRCAYWDSL